MLIRVMKFTQAGRAPDLKLIFRSRGARFPMCLFKSKGIFLFSSGTVEDLIGLSMSPDDELLRLVIQPLLRQ